MYVSVTHQLLNQYEGCDALFTDERHTDKRLEAYSCQVVLVGMPAC
jgi:hypothetical protein